MTRTDPARAPAVPGHGPAHGGSQGVAGESAPRQARQAGPASPRTFCLHQEQDQTTKRHPISVLKGRSGRGVEAGSGGRQRMEAEDAASGRHTSRVRLTGSGVNVGGARRRRERRSARSLTSFPDGKTMPGLRGAGPPQQGWIRGGAHLGSFGEMCKLPVCLGFPDFSLRQRVPFTPSPGPARPAVGPAGGL